MYRISVEQITITEYPETERKYVDPKTGNTFTSLYDDKCPPSSQLTKVDEPTGRVLERRTATVVYEQTFSDLEVNLLASFLNKERAHA